MIGISSCFYIKKQSVKGFTAFNGQKKRTPLPISEDEFAEQLIKGGAICGKDALLLYGLYCRYGHFGTYENSAKKSISEP